MNSLLPFSVRLRGLSVVLALTPLLGTCGTAPLESEPAAGRELSETQKRVLRVAWHRHRTEFSDVLTGDGEATPQLSTDDGDPAVDESRCDPPLALHARASQWTHDHDAVESWAVLCHSSSSCGSFSWLKIIREGAVVHEVDEYYSAYFNQELMAKDIDGDGVEELVVLSTSQDPGYGASVVAQVWAHRGDRFVDLWRERSLVKAPRQGDSAGAVEATVPAGDFVVLDHEVLDEPASVPNDEARFVIIVWHGDSQEPQALAARSFGQAWRWQSGAGFVRDLPLEASSWMQAARQRWIGRYGVEEGAY